MRVYGVFLAMSGVTVPISLIGKTPININIVLIPELYISITKILASLHLTQNSLDEFLNLSPASLRQKMQKVDKTLPSLDREREVSEPTRETLFLYTRTQTSNHDV